MREEKCWCKDEYKEKECHKEKECCDKKCHDKKCHEKDCHEKECHDKKCHEKDCHDKKCHDKKCHGEMKRCHGKFKKCNCFVSSARLNFGEGVNAIAVLYNPKRSKVKLEIENIIFSNVGETQLNVMIIVGGCAIDTFNQAPVAPVNVIRCRCAEATGELLYSIGGRIIGGAVVAAFSVAANSNLEVPCIDIDYIEPREEVIFLFSTPNNLGTASATISVTWCEKKIHCLL